MVDAPSGQAATRLPAWKRWGFAAIAFYALKGVVWLILGWMVLGD